MSMYPSGFFSGHRSNFMCNDETQFVANNPFSDPFFQNTRRPFQGHPHFFGAPSHVPHPPFFHHHTTSYNSSSKFEWKETAEGHVLTAELPGMTKEDVKVEAVDDGRFIAVSGEKKMDKEEKTGDWHRVERSSGSFVRRFRLPESAVAGCLSTCLENGVLTVTVTKKNDQIAPVCISGE